MAKDRAVSGWALLSGLLLCAACSLPTTSALAATVHKGAPSIVVAQFELVQTAPADQQYDVAADERRIRMVSFRARKVIERSGLYRVLDRGSKDTVPPFGYLSCRACIWQWGRSRGAQFILVSWVTKESRLILSVGMLLLDVKTHSVVREASTQIRDDTDRMWLRATDYLLAAYILSNGNQEADERSRRLH